MHKTLFLRIMCTMKKAITTVHTIFVIVILLATAGWSAYYLFNQRRMNSEIIAKKIPVLASDVSDFFVKNDSLYNNAFSDKIKGIFEDNQDLTALSIYSYDTGIEYFYSRNNQVRIKTAEENSDEGRSPQYKGLGFVHSIGTIPLNLASKPGTNIDCVFTVLPGGSIFYILKISLIIVIALFFVTLILIVVFSMSAGRTHGTIENDEKWSPDETGSDIEQDILPGSEERGFSDSKDTDDFSFNDEISLDDAGDDISLDSFDSEQPDTELELSSEDSVNLDEDFDMPSDEPLDLDDLNLEDSIPDIPDNDDLLAMDHEETAASFDELDSLDLPSEEEFGDMSFDEEIMADELSDSDSDITASSLYNPHSGLGWEHFLEERLSLELERAASFDQDLVLIILKNSQAPAETWEKLTSLVKEKFRYSDLVFEAGENSLAIIDPNKDLDESIEDIQNFLKSLEESIGSMSTTVGLSSRNGRLISGNRLIREASSSLNKADKENPIVGFRSDPERFREFLGKN